MESDATISKKGITTKDVVDFVLIGMICLTMLAGVYIYFNYKIINCSNKCNDYLNKYCYHAFPDFDLDIDNMTFPFPFQNDTNYTSTKDHKSSMLLLWKS